MQTIPLSVSIVSMSKTVLFQTIQFSMSTQISSLKPIDRVLSGATTPGQCRPWSDGNEGALRISQSSSISGTSPADCLVSYPGEVLLGVFYSPSLLGKCLYVRVCLCQKHIKVDWKLK